MVKNLKVDIIYHKSASDFEMEFNLCGCCRMRLLTDKTDDKKNFIKALAKDVSRSSIIIACGPLFGAEGLINMVAMAIGNSTAVCDNKTYGINSDEKINIINGSTPLVTPDGYFGGCIIESGPQTIILLTENKGFRKTIMQNLIHPYVEEISYIPTKNTSILNPVNEPESQDMVDDQSGYLTTPDKDYEEEFDKNAYESEQISSEHNVEFIMDDVEESELQEDPAPVSEEVYNMYTEIENPEQIQSRYEENPYTPSEGDNMFLSETDVNYDDVSNSYKKEKAIRSLDITIVVLVLLLLLAVLALVYFIVLKPMTEGVAVSEYLNQIFGISDITESML